MHDHALEVVTITKVRNGRKAVRVGLRSTSEKGVELGKCFLNSKNDHTFLGKSNEADLCSSNGGVIAHLPYSEIVMLGRGLTRGRIAASAPAGERTGHIHLTDAEAEKIKLHDRVYVCAHGTNKAHVGMSMTSPRRTSGSASPAVNFLRSVSRMLSPTPAITALAATAVAAGAAVSATSSRRKSYSKKTKTKSKSKSKSKPKAKRGRPRKSTRRAT